MVERLWRSVKYEEVYLKDYQDAWEAADGLETYFSFYNFERPHQSLSNRTPAEVYRKELKIKLKQEKKNRRFLANQIPP